MIVSDLPAAVGEQVGKRGDGGDVGALVEQEQHGGIHPPAGGSGGGDAGGVGDVLDEGGHEPGGGAGAAVGRQGIQGAVVTQDRLGGDRRPRRRRVSVRRGRWAGTAA